MKNSKQNKQKIRNYFVVMIATNIGAVVTTVVDSEETKEWVERSGDYDHVAVQDRGVRIHLYHNFQTMDSFEVISSCGKAADIVHEILQTELMPVYMEITLE